MKTVLVTGVAGFIGSHLADALLRRGDRVVGLDNFNDYYDPAIKRANLNEAVRDSQFVLHEVDICEEVKVREIFEETLPDVVVHLAARAGVRPSLQDPKLYHTVNIIGSQHILDASRDFGPGHLVMASSSSVYGGITQVPFQESMDISRPISPYAATKQMNELMGHVYHHVYGLNVTLLRFFTVYGPRQRPDMAIHKFVKLIAAGEPVPMFGDGTTRRDYTYIDDIISGVLSAIERPFGYEVINLGEQATISLKDLIELIGIQMNVDVRIDRKPMQPGDVTVTHADISKARQMLDYDPQYSMEQGIREFLEWNRKEN